LAGTVDLVALAPSPDQTEMSATSIRLRWQTQSRGVDPGTLVHYKFNVFMWEVDTGLPPKLFNVEIDYAEGNTEFDPTVHFANSKLLNGVKYGWSVFIVVKDTHLGIPDGCPDIVGPGFARHFTTEVAVEARRLEPGDYTFGYFLFDSKTGRRSAFSEIAHVEDEHWEEVTAAGTPVSLPDPGGGFVARGTGFVYLELVYDSDKFDQAYVFRSVKVQDAGGTFVAGVLLLDGIIDIANFHSCLNGTGKTFDPAKTDLRHALYSYRLEDKQLIFQDVYTDRSIFDESMPFGGTALFYETTMLVASITKAKVSTGEESRPFDAAIGLGELRWSSLVDISPELFPPFNRYVPTLPSNVIKKMVKVGGNAIGFSSDRMYHVRRHNVFIKVAEMHEGFGIVNHRAVDVVGSLAYFVSHKGLKAVDSSGQLDDVRVMNSRVIEDWKDDFDNIHVAYDPLLSVLFVVNTVKKEATLLWFNTSMTTELVDLPFALVKQGSWPSNFVTKELVYDIPPNFTIAGSPHYVNSLTERALFLQNAPDTGAPLIDKWKPRIYQLTERTRTITNSGDAATNGQPKIRLLDTDGGSRMQVSSKGASLFDIDTSLPNTDAAGEFMEGAFAYIIESATASNVGLKQQIRRVTFQGGTTWRIELTATPSTMITALLVGDRVAVSPVYFRWIGHNLGITDAQGNVFGGASFSRIKQANTLGSAFTDVSGPPTFAADTSTDAKYRGAMFSGTDTTAKVLAIPVDTEGVAFKSVVEGEPEFYAGFASSDPDVEGKYGVAGNSLSPAVEIICPDLDFRLLEANVRGRIMGTERARVTRST